MQNNHLSVDLIPAFEDNYFFVLEDQKTNTVAVVDPGDAAPVIEFLEQRNKKLDLILNTHHHHDHTGGNKQLKNHYGCKVIGPANERKSIPAMDHAVSEPDTISIGQTTLTIMDVPGHTKGHIAYFDPNNHLLFCGDTLFAMGCGRLFEGSAEQMWESLLKIRSLPDDTLVYCAHEYTMSNGHFAQQIDPNNQELNIRMKQVTQSREQGKPTIPTTIKIEKQTNPFLRADHPDLIKQLGYEALTTQQVFAHIRKAKDQF